MNKVQTIIHTLGLAIALTATLPVSAEERNAQENRAVITVKPVASKAIAQPFDGDVMQGLEAPAAGPAPQKNEGVDPAITPYITYDGAANTNPDR